MSDWTSEDAAAPARTLGAAAAWLGGAMRRGARAAVDLVYPPSCAACSAATDQPHALCPACWSSVPWIERPYCERLGTPFAVDLGEGLLSPGAISAPPAFERARAVARYDGLGRELVHKLKYGDRMDLAPMMGRWMARAGRDVLAEADLVVPTPLHRGRLWRRRMNQAAALASVVARASDRELALDCLERRRPTRSQVGLTRNERAENLQGAFACTPAGALRLRGRRVLLVDDVMTTGSTANVASRALLRGGAAAVDVLTFASVCRPA